MLQPNEKAEFRRGRYDVSVDAEDGRRRREDPLARLLRWSVKGAAAEQQSLSAAGQLASPAAVQQDFPTAGQLASPAAGQRDFPVAGQLASPTAAQLSSLASVFGRSCRLHRGA